MKQTPFGPTDYDSLEKEYEKLVQPELWEYFHPSPDTETKAAPATMTAQALVKSQAGGKGKGKGKGIKKSI